MTLLGGVLLSIVLAWILSWVSIRLFHVFLDWEYRRWKRNDGPRKQVEGWLKKS